MQIHAFNVPVENRQAEKIPYTNRYQCRFKSQWKRTYLMESLRPLIHRSNNVAAWSACNRNCSGLNYGFGRDS